ncbi:hypothetical protein [Streptomyces sp. NPDC048659]|uniref:hypothetical protein n=1 Tax=Streptomyces sp. NPDC048659 TaxID=3155489 RepID=UPI00344A5C30
MTFTLSGAAAQADTPDDKPRPTIEVSLPAKGAKSALDLVSCQFTAQKPNYSGNKMSGVGGILSCTPHTPQACNSEVDVEWYAPGPGQWLTVASSARQYSCPPPYRYTTAAFTCEYNASDPLYSYRTRTLGSFTEDGQTATVTPTSAVLQARCL